MKRFCGSCGTEAGPTNKFCAGCGAALRVVQAVDATVVRGEGRRPGGERPSPARDADPVASVPRATSGSATTPPPLPPLPGGATGADAGPPPVSPSSFEGQDDVRRPSIAGGDRPGAVRSRLSVGDLIRDVAAIAAAFAALTVAWDPVRNGSDRWWVVVAVLLLVASLGVPYLHRFGLTGGLPVKQVRWIVAGANVPALLSILVAVVDTVARVGSGEPVGLGGGVILLSAATVLAIAPRAGEPITAHASSWWVLIARGLGALALVVAVLTTVVHLVFDDFAWSEPAVTIVIVVYQLGGVAVLFAVPWFQGLKGSVAGLVIAIVVGATIAVTEILADTSQVFQAQFALPEEPVTMAFFLVVATAAALASRPLLIRARRGDGVEEWVDLAKLALGLAAAGAGLQAMLAIAGSSIAGLWDGPRVAVAILMAVIVLVCGLLTGLLSQDAGRGRAPAVLAASLVVVLGIVTITVADRSGAGYVIDWSTVASFVVLPLVAIGALVVPSGVRQRFGPLYTPPAEHQGEQAHA